MARKESDTGMKLFDSQDAVSAMAEGYYSGDQPNPNLRTFVEEHATLYDPESDEYELAAFNQPIISTKATTIYNMHTYSSKKPHEAIRQYIGHHTRPGDLVLDPFCGSGGTALAALMDRRQAIALDRSPAATFLTKNHCTPINPADLEAAYCRLQKQIANEIDWLYATACDRCGGKAVTGYTVYSKVFQCSRCLAKVPLYDCVTVDSRDSGGKPKKLPVCPHCHPRHVEPISTNADNTHGTIPVYVTYQCESGCKPKRGERTYDDPDPRRKEFFERYDLEKLKEIELREIPHWFPRHRMMNDESDVKPWGEKWRAGSSNFRTVAELFSKRNLWALATIRAGIKEVANGDIADTLLFALTGVLLNSSKMYQEREGGRGIAKGSYYLPPISREMVVTNGFSYKVEQQLLPAYRELLSIQSPSLIISTQSATRLGLIPSNCIDYIFTDPPYADKIQYGELNFVWEAWLDVDTRWHAEEIIVNAVRGKSELEWAAMMKEAMSECYRVLKPGRWLSLCYHDTSEGTWELIQDIMAEVGFVVDKTASALFIDTGQKSYNQLTADKSTKRDLVLNFLKPKRGEWLVAQILIPSNVDKATFQELGQQVIRNFLTVHPGATKDRIYDALVSCLVRKGQMEAHDFDSLLESVAEEVQQPVKEDLFRNKEPDLFGSHVQSRWYLKETADHIDHAEQAKEDAAAARLGEFIGEYVKKRPEFEGVHYSDLFEQYLPVHDKPRRLLADWLVEYFIKTTSGTWRLPDKEEGQQLAKLRAAGTLRRIKRFANSLIEGVPIRDNDRPGGDVDLLDWLRQCRRAGLYEQGKAIYEKGGLNSANLTDEQQIEAEDDYRICARRGSTEEAKPKRQRRKEQDDDDE